jgi:hypothetical protein
MHIRLGLVVIALAVLATIGLCETAQAEMFAAGPVYGGPASVGGTFTCRLFNFGAFSVTVTNRQIWDNTGVAVAPTADTCNVALVVGKTCAYSTPIAGNLAYSCRAIVQGIQPEVSGVGEVQAPNHSILNALPLHR